MFTGIIEATGHIARIEQIGGDWRLHLESRAMSFSDVALGDSIAVSGVCLTAIAIYGNGFAADVSTETLDCTTLGFHKVGDLVNLEKALTPQSRLGGHIVSGHVDGVGELLGRKPDSRSERLQFRVPQALSRYIAQKGSVCIDGVSLTVNEVQGNEFSVNIIPHTAVRTTLHLYQTGRKMNIEVDVIIRYLEKLLQTDSMSGQGITLDKLHKAGFAGKQVPGS